MFSNLKSDAIDNLGKGAALWSRQPNWAKGSLSDSQGASRITPLSSNVNASGVEFAKLVNEPIPPSAKPVPIDQAAVPDKVRNNAAPAKTQEDDPDYDFWDAVDLINPLQHIPVLGTVYRAMSGDTIKDTTRIAGGGLFFGVLGVITATASVITKEATGNDLGEHILASLNIAPLPSAPAAPIQLAKAPPPAIIPPASGPVLTANTPALNAQNIAAALPPAPPKIAKATPAIAPATAPVAPVAQAQTKTTPPKTAGIFTLPAPATESSAPVIPAAGQRPQDLPDIEQRMRAALEKYDALQRSKAQSKPANILNQKL